MIIKKEWERKSEKTLEERKEIGKSKKSERVKTHGCSTYTSLINPELTLFDV